MRGANYFLLNPTEFDQPLVIRDLGPWDEYLTVTNAAEQVVEEIVRNGHLPDGRRLFYIDSEGLKDELLVRDGRFGGFAFGPERGGPG